MRGRVHRKDLPTLVVLAVVNTYGPRAWYVLTETYPPKVVLAAYRRDTERGYLDCGSEAFPWVEPEGLQLMRHERYKVYGF